MKKQKIVKGLLTVMSLSILSWAFPLFSAKAAVWDLSWKKQLLVSKPGYNPYLSLQALSENGEWLVYQLRQSNYPYTDQKLFVGNIQTGQEFLISDADTLLPGTAVISGDGSTVYYADNNVGGVDIFKYTVPTQTNTSWLGDYTMDTTLHLDTSHDGSDLLVDMPTYQNVYWFRTVRANPVSVNKNGGGFSELSMSGNTLVWQDLRDSQDYDIWMRDYTSGQETPLTVDGDRQTRPMVSADGTLATWLDERNGGIDLYGWQNGSEFRITENSAVSLEGYRPVAHNQMVFWLQDNQTLMQHIVGKNVINQLYTGTNLSSFQVSEDGNVLIWKENNQLYRIKINTEPEISLTSSDNQMVSPSTPYLIEGSGRDVDAGDKVWIKYAVDQESERAATYFTSDGGIRTFSLPVTFDNLVDGNHVLTVWMQDDKGKTSAKITRNFTFDHTPPIGSFTSILAADKESADLTITATDTAGVKQIQLPSGEWVSGNTATYHVERKGTYSFLLEDNLGNRGSYEVKVLDVVRGDDNPLSWMMDKLHVRFSSDLTLNPVKWMKSKDLPQDFAAATLFINQEALPDWAGGEEAGQLKGNPSLTQDETGKRWVSFDGVDDEVLFAAHDTLNLTEGTLEAWIQTNDAGTSYRGLVVKPKAYGFFLLDNELVFYDWSGAQPIKSGKMVNDGKRHHVAMTFQSGVTNGTTLYVDGMQAGQGTMTVLDQTMPLVLGNGNPASQKRFQGLLQEARVWNKVLSVSEIGQIMTSSVKGREEGLIGYWRFQK